MRWHDITFGIEFEAGAVGPTYREVIAAAERSGFPHPVAGSRINERTRRAIDNCEAWTFNIDGGGIETKTPVCLDHNWPEIVAMMNLMREKGCSGTNEQSGMHTHYSTQLMNRTQQFRALVGWWTFEPTFFKLVAPYRQNSGWCHPIRERFGTEAVARVVRCNSTLQREDLMNTILYDCTRHAFGPNGGWPTFENRVHDCCLNPPDVYGWVQGMRALIDHWANEMGDPLEYMANSSMNTNVRRAVGFLQERIASKLPAFMHEAVCGNFTDRLARYGY